MYSRWVDCHIGMFHTFRRPPYGGSNQFFLALKKELSRRKYLVRPNCIKRNTKGAIVNAFAFDNKLLRKLRNDGCRIIHRVVGPVSIYRGTDDRTADIYQWEMNREFADATVFQSQYSYNAYTKIEFQFKSPVVIMNAVDPDVFHPGEKRKLSRGKIRLITTSWSDNLNKGADTYKWLDENLDWERYEFIFVGRISSEFKNIRVIPPVHPKKLAALLRDSDIYITASLYDTCSNALIEALACKLPAIFAISGGNGEIAKRGGFGFHEKDEIPALLDRLIDEYEDRQRMISIPSLAKVADRYLSTMGLPNYNF